MIDSKTVRDFGRRNNRPTLVTAVWVCLFVVVSITAIGLRLSNRTVVERSPDKKIYINYATRIAGSGIEGGRALVQIYNRDIRLWIYLPPTRLGYIYLVAALMKLSGASAEGAAVSISSIFSIGGFFVTALLGLRFFNRWAVLIGLALLSVSPIELAIARRAWQDSVWGCIGELLFFLCVEASISKRSKIWRICFWAVGAYYLTIKGSATVVYGLACRKRMVAGRLSPEVFLLNDCECLRGRGKFCRLSLVLWRSVVLSGNDSAQYPGARVEPI